MRRLRKLIVKKPRKSSVASQLSATIMISKPSTSKTADDTDDKKRKTTPSVTRKLLKETSYSDIDNMWMKAHDDYGHKTDKDQNRLNKADNMSKRKSVNDMPEASAKVSKSSKEDDDKKVRERVRRS